VDNNRVGGGSRLTTASIMSSNKDDEDNFIENDIVEKKDTHITCAVSVDICNNEDEAAIELLKPSTGWKLPKVKLPVWNPEKQVSRQYIMCTFIAMITKFFTLHIQHISYQWNTVGKDIANRNLIISIPNHLCCFGVWLIWSSISAKILEMHNADPNLYPFDDWFSSSTTPDDQETSSADYEALLYLLIIRCNSTYIELLFNTSIRREKCSLFNIHLTMSCHNNNWLSIIGSQLQIQFFNCLCIAYRSRRGRICIFND